MEGLHARTGAAENSNGQDVCVGDTQVFSFGARGRLELGSEKACGKRCGIAFVCLWHFTCATNMEGHGRGDEPWFLHLISHDGHVMRDQSGELKGSAWHALFM